MGVYGNKNTSQTSGIDNLFDNKLDKKGGVLILPTEQPSIAGVLWNNEGVVEISIPESLRIMDGDVAYHSYINQTSNGKIYSGKSHILVNVYDSDFNVLYSFDIGAYDGCYPASETTINDYFIIERHNNDFLSGELILYDQDDYSTISTTVTNGALNSFTSRQDIIYFSEFSKIGGVDKYTLYEMNIDGTILNTYNPTTWGFADTVSIFNKVSDGTYLYVFFSDGTTTTLLKLDINDLSVEIDRLAVADSYAGYNMIALDGNELYFGTPDEEYKAYILDTITMTITHTFENPMDGGVINEGFGSTVQVTGDYVFIGANLHGNWGAEMGGKVFVYDKTTKALLYKVQSDNLKPDIAGFGINLVVDDTYLYVCSPGEHSGSLHRFLLTDIIVGDEYYAPVDA